MSNEPARYEINRQVRNILVAHNADMTKVSYSSSYRTVSIYGCLVNNDLSDFNVSTIKALVSDLMNISSVQTLHFDLDNWIIVAEPGELTIVKGKEYQPLPWEKDEEQFR